MERKYRYGNEVQYSKLRIVKPGDKKLLQAFSCGNDVLDNYIRSEIFEENDAQGLHFITIDKEIDTNVHGIVKTNYYGQR